VSGFVIDDLYVAGDTIWCAEVDEAITRHRPRVVVVNGSAARFVDSEPLVMTTADIQEVVRRVPLVIVVHLEAINHCVDTRAFVRQEVPQALVPEDGETVMLEPEIRPARVGDEAGPGVTVSLRRAAQPAPRARRSAG
jgi:hypothetical protein